MYLSWKIIHTIFKRNFSTRVSQRAISSCTPSSTYSSAFSKIEAFQTRNNRLILRGFQFTRPPPYIGEANSFRHATPILNLIFPTVTSIKERRGETESSIPSRISTLFTRAKCHRRYCPSKPSLTKEKTCNVRPLFSTRVVALC